MNLFFHLLICVVCVAFIYIFSTYNHWWNVSFESEILVIGILSARENFKLREAARSSWLKYFFNRSNYSVKSWFIIGEKDCPVPPKYRLSKYGCDKWNINGHDISDSFYTSLEVTNGVCDSRKVFNQGFSFKVNHPVIIKKLGLLSYLLAPNIETNVAIFDIQTKEILVNTSISKNSSLIENGYIYGNVEPVLLPRYYEGMVLVEGYLQKEACVNVLWNDGGGVITFNRIYSTPSHFDSTEFSNDTYSAASIQFFVHDIDGLKDLISQENTVTSEWLFHLKDVNKRILSESEAKQDIVFVDVMDTYRNLPLKLLHFYKWIIQNHQFSFLMKMDDDTVVNIALLLKQLESHPSFIPNKQFLWSWLRKDWPVNYIGKWADYDYRSSVYPAFPCGASYVMSHRTVEWLSLNADFLFSYQGEDVSLGIWLSAVKADFIDDENFECESTCSKKSYNRAQLTASQIYEVSSLYEQCQNLCSCD